MDAFGTMDSETAALILQLQIQDSDELFSACEGKGKGIEGVLTDTQLALQLYKEGLQRSATIIADQNMARSLASLSDRWEYARFVILARAARSS